MKILYSLLGSSKTRVIYFFLLILIAPGIRSHAYGQQDLRERANSIFGKIPLQMKGADNDSPEQIALGERLYFEKALSINNTQSCNSCHNILDGGAGVDNLKTSIGALGESGRRNAASTWNAGFQFAQNWDAGAKTLAEQARLPILDPLEMAMPSGKKAVKQLKRAGYKKAFKLAFPGEARPLNYTNTTRALAAFQRTLITQDRFDLFLDGDEAALNDQEKRGLSLVLNKGCSICHSGPLMGGQFIIKMGLVNPYPNTEDKGHGEVTGRKQDDFLFKVPILRHIAQTAPFFHDGAATDLEQAVFDTGWHQIGIKFDSQQVSDISAFLRSLDNTRPFKRKHGVVED